MTNLLNLTHTTGAPADDRRVALTAVLADATNLGLTRMAAACAVASYRQLAWTAARHLREETYRQALAILVNAQQRQPLAASFAAADVSNWDGQHFPTAGPGEAVGAVNNFALAYLLGFYFAPRIPNLAERRFYTSGPTSAWPVLERSSPAASTKS